MEPSGTKVLVIDDHADTRESTRVLLELHGFAVSVARNGKEALELYGRAPSDVVLSDIFMPEKDGVETVQELRRINPRVQIAVMTGSEQARMEMLRVVMRELGVTRLLRKPVDPPVLIATLEEMARFAQKSR